MDYRYNSEKNIPLFTNSYKLFLCVFGLSQDYLNQVSRLLFFWDTAQIDEWEWKVLWF